MKQHTRWIMIAAYVAAFAVLVMTGSRVGRLPSYGPWTAALWVVAGVAIAHAIVHRIRSYKSRCPACANATPGLCRAHESIRAMLALVIIAALSLSGLMMIGILGWA